MKREFELWMSEIKPSNLDHTCIWSADSDKEPEQRAYGCFGGITKQTHLLSVEAGSGARDRADYCRSTRDSCTINYGIDGVCHQAASRFLYLSSNAHPSIDWSGRKPGGYSGWAGSRAVYGVHGRGFAAWVRNWADVAYARYPDNNEGSNETAKSLITEKILELYLHNEEKLDDNQLIVQENIILLQNEFTKELNLNNNFSIEYLELLQKADRLYEEYGFKTGAQNNLNLSKDELRDIFKKANDIYKEVQVLFKNALGEKNYKKYNRDEADIYDIIDIDLAIEIYSK